MKSDEKRLLDRIKHLEDALQKASEYLSDGSHAHWHGFRPLFKTKQKDGEVCPPHPHWIEHVFIPHMRKRLDEAMDRLDWIQDNY